MKIWSNLLEHLPGSEIQPDDIPKLGLWDLNGRQINNALRMTLAWCKQDNKSITFEAIEDTIQLTCPRSIRESLMVSTPIKMANGELEKDAEQLSLLDL